MKKKNENCLDGLKCPKCGSLEPFYITARTVVAVWDDGAGDTQDFEWDEDSYCTCEPCGFSGVLRDFQILPVNTDIPEAGYHPGSLADPRD